MPCPKGGEHVWLCEPPEGRTSSGACRKCGAAREFRNYLSPQEADILAGNRPKEEEVRTIMPEVVKPTASPSPPPPLPLEMTPNDLIITSFAYRVNPEISQDRTVKSIEFSGGSEAIKALVSMCQKGEIVVTLKFREGGR